jgi:adenylate kinase family enzyme
MKIRIIGPCGSGKTYVSKRLSEKLQIQYYETDNIIWNRNENKKYSIDVRNDLLNEILVLEDWIIEGAQYKWSFESFEKANIIYILKPSALKRDLWVLKRFISMQLGLKTYHYKQSLKELLEMLIQNAQYDKESFDDIIKRTEVFKDKRIIVNDNMDILRRNHPNEEK